MQEELLLEILNVVKRSETENKKAFKEETRTAINGLEEKVDKLETKFDGLEGKVDKLDVKTDRIEKHIVDEMNDTSQMMDILFGQTSKITNYLDLTWDIKQIN